MDVLSEQIHDHNKKAKDTHDIIFDALSHQLTKTGVEVANLLEKVTKFQIAIPSWALGSGGTRFGRFATGGEPRNLEEKIEDVGLLHALNNSSGAISLHIPWDIPKDAMAVREKAKKFNLLFDAVNSNTFQDQPDQKYSYKFGSLSHTKVEVREQAIIHNIEVIKYGKEIGSKALTVWLADGSNFPGQQNFSKALENTETSLHQIYHSLPEDWKLLIEYKPYEPNFYSMVIPDWGTSFLLANKLGERAKTLVDLGHHLPNTNIEQIVSILLKEGKLGGFHFNDSKYGDDDLTSGSLKPYQLFLIFNELIEGTKDAEEFRSKIAWMIDASHNVKDPLEDLLQSVELIMQAYVKALLIDREALKVSREENDPASCQEILQDAFQTDVRPILKEARIRQNAAIDPLKLYREMSIRSKLIDKRGADSVSTGL
jgi:L-rhamnose isomerase/sugar isomerase